MLSSCLHGLVNKKLQCGLTENCVMSELHIAMFMSLSRVIVHNAGVEIWPLDINKEAYKGRMD